MFRLPVVLAAMSLAVSSPALAAEPPSAFHAGTVITDFGKVATIADRDVDVPTGTVLRVAFDAVTGKEATLNRTLESAARFLNMHAEAGVPVEHQHLAIVVHGAAVFDVTTVSAYARKYPGAENPNAPLIAALHAKGARIIVCGQSAVAQGVEKAELLPGVELALSAMTAHALLQQQGYSLNPF
ncbi:MAG: DsrE family protein [Sphingopyxis sp.]|uniref:DsrE family protein n=1 Tax=Sphingopyxis sp. TaxID=1908224 RepID=UPI002AB8B9FB|nr:DsrE family protein [Sphingopyxis sp.]MDZ3832254.1 DsrE family protein [Sphingopyxis sp.]